MSTAGGTLHVLKCWPNAFQAIKRCEKHHEVRRNDRDYKVGDTLLLREYEAVSDVYSGAWIFAAVTYITYGGWEYDLPPNVCVMSIEVVRVGGLLPVLDLS